MSFTGVGLVKIEFHKYLSSMFLEKVSKNTKNLLKYKLSRCKYRSLLHFSKTFFWGKTWKYFSLILFVSAENDYNTAFYVSDAFFLVALLVSLTVRVTSSSEEPKNSGKHQKKENRKAIMQLFSPSALIFFAMIFQGGLMWGIKDTYFFVYLQGDIS